VDISKGTPSAYDQFDDNSSVGQGRCGEHGLEIVGVGLPGMGRGPTVDPDFIGRPGPMPTRRYRHAGRQGRQSGPNGGMPSKVCFPSSGKIGFQFPPLLQYFPTQTSSAKFRALKRAAAGRFCEPSLGFHVRNDTGIFSLNGRLSPELGAWPIDSTSFLTLAINLLAN
jgi:hypothetical protein